MMGFKSGSGYAVNLESATSATILNRRTENMANWESLIGERMRPAATVHRIEDPVQRNRNRIQRKSSRTYYWKHKDDEEFKRRVRLKSQKYYERIKDTTEYKERKRENDKKYRNTDKYRERHKLEMRIWRAKNKELKSPMGATSLTLVYDTTPIFPHPEGKV